MKQAAFISTGALVIAGVVVYSLVSPPTAVAAGTHPVRAERLKVDKLYVADPKQAAEKYEEFVAEHRDSPDKKVQDEVAAARLRLGYLEVKSDGYQQARETFLEAEKEYKGEGGMGSDFGGLKDQAAYQAAVCLMGDKKNKEALAAFRSFIEEYRLSPLVHAAHRRMEILAPDQQDAHDALLQKAIAAQEKHIRFETSVCGPKVIAHLLPKLGKSAKDYKEIAKLCGTTNDGTTVEGMRKALKALGMESYGYELNQADFMKLKPNAILLKDQHYVALIAITRDHVLVYDPVKGGEDKFPLPKADQADFSMPVLTFEPMTLEAGEMK